MEPSLVRWRGAASWPLGCALLLATSACVTVNTNTKTDTSININGVGPNPAGSAGPSSTGTSTAAALPAGSSTAPPTLLPRPSFWNTEHYTGLAVGGIGVTSAVAGFIFGGLALGKKSASNDPSDGGCHDGNQCPGPGYDLRTTALTYGNASTALLVVGGVATAVGVTVFVLGSRSHPSTETRAAIGPRGIELQTTW
jgi:hypothetical protein